MQKSKTFGEDYGIKAFYQKDDGFWAHIEETQTVQVVHGIKEKDNHNEAVKLFMEKHKHLKNLTVTSVTYH